MSVLRSGEIARVFAELSGIAVDVCLIREAAPERSRTLTREI
jgi:hypothetical protein